MAIFNLTCKIGNVLKAGKNSYKLIFFLCDTYKHVATCQITQVFETHSWNLQLKLITINRTQSLFIVVVVGGGGGGARSWGARRLFEPNLYDIQYNNSCFLVGEWARSMEGRCLFNTFSLRSGAYSRGVLIRSWALIGIFTVS